MGAGELWPGLSHARECGTLNALLESAEGEGGREGWIRQRYDSAAENVT